MKDLQELISEGKFKENLMADKEFVEGAKEIFKSENVEIDDKKLAELMGEIEARLKKDDTLNDKDLEEVSGGITGKGIAGNVMQTMSTAVGIAVGAGFGALGGGAFLGANGIASGLKEKGDIKPYASALVDSLAGVAVGGAAGGIAGGTAGGVIGYKLSKWILQKTGIKEK